MDGVADRPKWLLELENRKRKPRLAHEAGAGAPCMICNSACPGLDLHFWRKICKNCKCSRDDHDVEDDEFPQFDLLFGPSGKFKKRSMLLRVNDKKQKDAETTFEWVPPDTTEELATDYMNSLPMEKLPIKGSAGAVLRRQLLQKQMPLHDIDHKMCDGLTEDEKKQFEKYLENLKRYVGQGKVIKILGARPFDRSLMTPINATDMQRCSPQQKPKILSVQLRTPSSFTAKINTRSPYVKIARETSANHDTSNNTEPTQPAEDNFNSNLKKYDPVVSTTLDKTVLTSVPVQGGTYNNPVHSNSNLTKLDNSSRHITTTTTATTAPSQQCSPAMTHNIGEKAPLSKCSKMSQDKALHGGKCECSPLLNIGVSSQQQLPPDLATVSSQPHIQNYQETLTNPVYCLTHSEELNNKDVLTAELMLADALLPPSAIHANDIIGSTLDKEGLSYIREKLTNKYNVQEDPVLRKQPEMSQDLGKKSLVGKYNRMDAGNESIKDTDWKKSIPIANNSLGLENKDTQIIENVGSSGGSTSVETKRPVRGGSPAIIQSSSIHSIHCDNIGEKYNQSSICQPPVPQFSSILKATNEPRNTQSEPIEHLKIPNNCVDNTLLEPSCSSQLLPGNLQSDCFHTKVNSIHPVPPNIIYSESLQNQIFPHNAVGSAHQLVQNLPNVDHLKQDMEGLKVQCTKVQKCNKCQDDIHIGDVVVTVEKAKNESWHPGCFVCSVCNELLADLVYFYYKKKLYCGRDLAKLLGIPRCFACDELVFVREYTVAEGHNYHVKHFCCWDCDVPLAGQQYISENDRPLCLPCYQKTYAKTCSTCNVIIAADQQGVEIKNLNFHATETCFCCYTCKKSLLSGKMAIKEDRPFCSKECITTFLSSK